MAKIVPGIDLGTTFSVVAYVDDEGRPRVIPNADGKTTTPSAVLIQDGRITVGDAALNQWVTNEEHVVRWIKRAIGSGDYRFHGLSAVQISAEILKALKADAELFLGEPLEEAVITCPAYFAAIEIENTKRAGELAGFQVREVVKEPTAAAVYYGVEQMRDGETILVCDLGGGTFDATVLSFVGGVFLPRATMGDRQLGGHDWTMELVDLVAERFQERFGEDPRNDLVASQMLYEACEQAKRDLARVTETTIPCHLRGRMEQIVVTQEAFESKTEWRIQALVMWSERALEKAGLAWGDLDHILLVGGSSRLRRMALALEEHSRIRPTQIREPDLAVALGAAILARGQVRPRRPMTGLVESQRGGGLVEVNYKRIIARALGTRIIVFDGNTPRIINSLLIPHSTESPVSRWRDDFAVAANGQKVFDVPVVEFESDDVYDVVGNFRFTCLPNAIRGNRIKVTFHYDVSGIVTVEALDLQSGKALIGERLPYQEPNLEEVMRVRVRPRWVVFAVDVSYSMQGTKIANAKQALLTTARKLLASEGDGCNIGIVSFASSTRIVVPPTADLEVLERAIATLTASGGTAMDVGIRQALELVLAAPAGADRDVVMLTDGMPDTNRRQSTLVAAQEVRAQGVTLSSLGLGSQDVDLAFLQSLTPISLVIDAVESMAEGMSTLLTQAAAVREGSLIETATGRE